jgi:hypothetical protein
MKLRFQLSDEETNWLKTVLEAIVPNKHIQYNRGDGQQAPFIITPEFT